MPERIQLKRTKGWRLPAGAIVVSRPSKWGNPFRPELRDGEWIVVDDNGVTYDPLVNTQKAAIGKCVELFEDDGFEWFGGRFALAEIDVQAELAGHDLACWCPLNQPCHADVLLEVANGGLDSK